MRLAEGAVRHATVGTVAVGRRTVVVLEHHRAVGSQAARGARGHE